MKRKFLLALLSVCVVVPSVEAMFPAGGTFPSEVAVSSVERAQRAALAARNLRTPPIPLGAGTISRTREQRVFTNGSVKRPNKAYAVPKKRRGILSAKEYRFATPLARELVLNFEVLTEKWEWQGAWQTMKMEELEPLSPPLAKFKRTYEAVKKWLRRTGRTFSLDQKKTLITHIYNSQDLIRTETAIQDLKLEAAVSQRGQAQAAPVASSAYLEGERSANTHTADHIMGEVSDDEGALTLSYEVSDGEDLSDID